MRRLYNTVLHSHELFELGTGYASLPFRAWYTYDRLLHEVCTIAVTLHGSWSNEFLFQSKPGPHEATLNWALTTEKNIAAKEMTLRRIM